MVTFRILSLADWEVDILKLIFPMNDPPAVDLFEWNSGVPYTEIPDFFLATTLTNGWMSPHTSHFENFLNFRNIKNLPKG